MKPTFYKFYALKDGDFGQKKVKSLNNADMVTFTTKGKEQNMSVSEYRKMQNMDKYGMLRRPAVHHKPVGFFDAFFGLKR